MKTYRIAAIPGDGIGTEVIPAGIELLSRAADGFCLEFEHFDWSSQRFQQTGQYIPQGGLERLKAFDAIFFGAVGAPDVPDHLSLWGLRLPICQGFDQYANVRPARLLPGIKSPLEPTVGDVAPGLLEALRIPVEVLELEAKAVLQLLEDFDSRRDHLVADPVAGNGSDAVRLHAGTLDCARTASATAAPTSEVLALPFMSGVCGPSMMTCSTARTMSAAAS